MNRLKLPHLLCSLGEFGVPVHKPVVHLIKFLVKVILQRKSGSSDDPNKGYRFQLQSMSVELEPVKLQYEKLSAESIWFAATEISK